MSTLKENWRVVALVTLLLLSAVALFTERSDWVAQRSWGLNQ